MRRFKKIVTAMVMVIIVIQFIQPAHNESKLLLATDFTKVYAVPVNVQTVLQNACYDCHSNNTLYPWYSAMQPLAWMMRRHITNGKEGLNFSEFSSYPARRQVSKLKAIVNQIKDNEMPLSSYKMMHKNARLTPAERKIIIDWMEAAADSLSTNN
jgi:Haem-binding domain